MTEIPYNLPHAVRFVPAPGVGTGTPTSVVLTGPSPAVTKTAYGFVANGDGSYNASFLPDEIGPWCLIAKDTNGVVLYGETFRSVWARAEDYASRLTNKYHGTVDAFPAYFVQRNVAKTVTSLTRSGTTATATATAHGFGSGNTITLYGANPGGYNGNVVVTVVDANTFTYAVASTLATPATGSVSAAQTSPSSTSNINNVANTFACFLSTKKIVIPYTGLVYGIRLKGIGAVITVLNYIKFVVAAPTDSTWLTFTIRGMSEDFHATTPAEGSWQSGYSTIWFKTPVPARAGDAFGYEVSAAAGQVSSAHTSRTDIFSYAALTQALVWRPSNSAGVSTTATNTFSSFGSSTSALDLKPIMRPPAVAVAGHSFYSGFADDGSGSVATLDYNTQNASGPFKPATDLAAMVEQHLGLPVLNAAVGGSNLSQWVGAPSLTGSTSANSGGGWFEWLVAPWRPAAVVFDTDYNDADPSNNWTVAQYVGYLDRLLWHCDKYAVELILIEGPSSYAATGDARVANLERLRAAKRVWARQNGVCLIPAYYRLGQFGSVSGEKNYQRYAEKGSDAAGYLPDYQAGSKVHWTDAGRQAAAALIAQGVRSRQALPPMWATTGSDETTLVQPGARGVNGATISGGA